MEHDALVTQLSMQAVTVFETRGYFCSEAILVALNDGLGGGLPPDRARGLAMGFGEGLGQAGCMCGALGGAVLAVSWFLSGELSSAEVRQAARALHDEFRQTHGSCCCRVLIKPVRHDKTLHKQHCAKLTRFAAESAARMILTRLPHLAANVDITEAPRKLSPLAGLLYRLADRLNGK